MCHCSEKSCFKAQRKDNCTYLLYKTQNRAEKGCTYINKFSLKKKKEKSRERRQQNWEICVSIQKRQKKKKSLHHLCRLVSSGNDRLNGWCTFACPVLKSLQTVPELNRTQSRPHLQGDPFTSFLKCNARGFRLREGFPNTQIGYVNGSGNMVLATLNDQWLEHTRYRHQVHSCRKIYITSSLTPDLTPRLRAL